MSSCTDRVSLVDCSPISPLGGRIVVGVTPRTEWIALRVQPSSATICSLLKVVKACANIFVQLLMSRKNLLAHRVRPGVDADFVTAHVLIKEDIGSLDNARPNDEECRAKIFFLEFLK